MSTSFPVFLSHRLTANQDLRGVPQDLLQLILLLSSPGELAARVPLTSAVDARGLFVAGVAGKPRIQRPGEFADTATKDKAKDKEPRPAPSYLPV